MGNSNRDVSSLFGGLPTTIEIEDNSANLIVIQREDMVIHHTAQIASRYVLNGEAYWIVKTLGYNELDEVLYIETNPATAIAPEFIPEEVV